MDYFEAKEFMRKLYPNKKIDLSFDVNCLRKVEIIHTDGIPNPVHHLQYEKVKVSIEGMDDVYMSILPHRECASWEYIKNHINTLPNPSISVDT